MKSEITKPEINFYEAYANAMSTRNFIGKLMKFSKGDYLAGLDNEQIPVGSQFVAAMDSLAVGWIHWQDNRPVEQQMGLVAEGFQPPRRKELGDLDETAWQTDDDEGDARDPWQFTNLLVLIGADEGRELYTFSTSSRGGLGGIAELCKAYGKAMRQKPDQWPVVKLGVESYEHRKKAYGRIKYPVFEIVGWTDKGPFGELLDNKDSGGAGGAGAQATPAIAKPAAEAKAASEQPRF